MHRCDRYYLRLTIIPAILLLCAAASLSGQIVPTNDPPVYGQYSVVSLQGGDGVHKNMVAKDTVLRADSPWTIYCWVNADAPIAPPVLVAGMGDVAAECSRYRGLEAGKLMLWMGADNSFSTPATITPGKWQFIAASFDGAAFRLYSDGAQVGQGSLILGTVAPVLQIAPPVIPWPNGQREQFHPNRVIGHALAKGIVVLLRQHGRRHQHRDLFAVHHRLERRADADLRLAEADISADQPVHWFGPFHVGLRLDDGALLVRRLLEDESALELALPGHVCCERMSGLRFARGLDGEQVAGDVPHRPLRMGFGLGPTGASQRVERWPRLARADILADQVRLGYGHIELRRWLRGIA